MPFDLIAFGEAAPGTGTPNIAAGIAETLYKFTTDTITIKKEKPFLLGVFAAVESTGGYVLLRQPSLQLDYEFAKIALLGTHDPIQGYTHMFGRPLPLVGGEILQALINNATDEDAIIGLLVGNGKIPQSSLDAVNPTHRIRGVADSTCTAMQWNNVTITWDDDLEVGTYAVVGMTYGYYKASAAMPALARLVLPGHTDHRPGVVGVELQADKLELQELTMLPCIHWPLMPEVIFEHDTPPNLEVYAAEATTDHLVELLLQKIR